MKRTLITGILVSGLMAVSLTALAGPTCTEAPQEEWMSEEAMQQQIADMGYEIKEFKTTDGNCYEIYGWDDQERRVEIYFNPVDGSIVKQEID
ncbi:PepSY domain-containing protein [Halomonas sp. 1390]|uniref:PepSY domain-containing protein n=1 Tax=Halomonas sp. B23F22_3 TaxID=3459516 RepID=UPI00373FA9D8